MEITEGEGIIQSENYPSNYPGRFHQNSTELELDHCPGPGVRTGVESRIESGIRVF